MSRSVRLARTSGRLRRAAWLCAVGAAACRPSTRKLDETVFHAGPALRLKLARYHANYPLHFVGTVYTVQCASARTAAAPALDRQDSGWVTLGGGTALESRSAAELVPQQRAKYQVLDDSTLVWTDVGLSVTRDACGTTRSWFPRAVPRALLDTLPRPEWCRPRGTADCDGYDFQGDSARLPRFTDVRVHDDGRVEFVLRSRAIRDGGALRVGSVDGGRTWSLGGAPPVAGSTSGAPQVETEPTPPPSLAGRWAARFDLDTAERLGAAPTARRVVGTVTLDTVAPPPRVRAGALSPGLVPPRAVHGGAFAVDFSPLGFGTPTRRAIAWTAGTTHFVLSPDTDHGVVTLDGLLGGDSIRGLWSYHSDPGHASGAFVLRRVRGP